jgi:8-oxo-dGTP pyrophosphatase MutT (NUDIX family)
MMTSERVSAGGVGFRLHGDLIEIAIIRSARESRWQLPKGIIDPGETEKEAAVREVREEAGVDCDLLAKIDSIDYWYVDRWGDEPVRVHKFVHFYLMKYTGGDIADHDHEVEEVRWVRIDDAVEQLAFPAEQMIAKKAREMIP